MNASNIDSLIEPTGHNLPELPTEIWLAIFRWVTWVPDILDSSRSFHFRRGLSWTKHEPLRESLVRGLTWPGILRMTDENLLGDQKISCPCV